MRSLLLASLLLSAGCATLAAADRRNLDAIDADLASWVGHPAADVVASWGPPTYAIDDGPRGSVLVWNPELTAPNCQSFRPRRYDRDVVRSFRVDPDGVVTRWSWRGRYFPRCATALR